MSDRDLLTSGGDYKKYARILSENFTKILLLTAVFVFVGGLTTLALPRTYSSNAIIQLGEFNGKPIYNGLEAKTILLSSSVLDPVLLKHYQKEDINLQKLQRDLTVEFVKEEVGYRQTLFAIQMNVSFKADDPVEARDVLTDVLDSFFNFVNQRVEEIKYPLILEHNTTVSAAYNAYIEVTEDLDKQIRETDTDIIGLEKNVADMEKQIPSIKDEAFSTEGMTKMILLSNLYQGLNDKLLQKRVHKRSLEERKTQEKIAYDNTVMKAQFNLAKQMAAINEFSVISEPQTPESPLMRKLIRNLTASLLFGLFFSSAFVVLTDFWKKTPTEETYGKSHK